MPTDPPEQDADDVVVCDLAAAAAGDLGTVEMLARLHLAARRGGRTLRLRGAADELVDLLRLVGLADVLGLAAEPPEGLGRSGLQARRQPEQGEQPCGVEEGGDAGDAAV